MTKKQIAALAAALVTVLSSLAVAVAGNVNAGGAQTKADSISERVKAVEVKAEQTEKRLIRIEDKQDRTLEAIYEIRKGR